MTKAEFTSAVKNVFDACQNLSKISSGIRNFTPDGRMVGDIGEVIAVNFYGVKLHNEGRHHWDGTYNNRNVQIKATGGTGTYLKEPPNEGFGNGLLMVFYIDRKSGQYELIYCGDIQRVWDALERIKTTRAGEKMISLNRLKELQLYAHSEDLICEI